MFISFTCTVNDHNYPSHLMLRLVLGSTLAAALISVVPITQIETCKSTNIHDVGSVNFKDINFLSYIPCMKSDLKFERLFSFSWSVLFIDSSFSYRVMNTTLKVVLMTCLSILLSQNKKLVYNKRSGETRLYNRDKLLNSSEYWHFASITQCSWR